MAFLSTTPVSVLVDKPKEVIAFNGDLTIGDAIDVLGHYELFGAPVVSKQGHCIGHVDYVDLLCQLVQLTSDHADTNVWPPSVNMKPEDLETMTRRANDWTLQELVKSGCIRVSTRDPFFYASPSDSLLQCLAYFGRGVHHLLLVDPPTGRVLNLVSQSDIIRFLAKDTARLGAFRARTVRQLQLGSRGVYAVRNTDSALDSFFELYQHAVSGGAIINAEGKLVGNLSRHDLKGTQGGTGFTVLSQSIMHYQRKHRVALAQRMVTVTPEHTIGDIIATMAREKVHRVFVVEGGMYPKGLVTQTDVCRVLYDNLADGKTKMGKKALSKLMKQHCETKLDFPLQFPPQ